MKRALVMALLLAAVAGGAATSIGAGGAERDGLRYDIVFDNAFGLVEGADFKVGGVAVGSIERLEVERRTSRARVTVSVEDSGFGRIRSDAFCQVSPQSLIGEYFVDCEPGRRGRPLPSGATIPVERTASPIPADLVQNILREPYRERLRIILDHLGAGLAARGPDLNETIRRAIPALRETERVLEILGDNRRVLRELARDSGRVLDVLGDRRRDVGRFVVEARDTAQASADRRVELAETFRRFPGFLDELEPTLRDLGTAARRQAPALADLQASAGRLTGLLRTLPPFEAAARPALESLGDASRTGRRAAVAARPTVAELRRLGEGSAEPARNASLILRDLDDRERAVEPDPDSPGGKGFTGFEALLSYVFNQSLAINVFDRRGYLLKLNALINECTEYAEARDVRENPERAKRCSAGLGPNQPGINQPDPSPPEGGGGERRAGAERRGGRAPAARTGNGGPATRSDRRQAAAPSADPLLRMLPQLGDVIDRLPKAPGGRPLRPAARDALLDFLLAP